MVRLCFKNSSSAQRRLTRVGILATMNEAASHGFAYLLLFVLKRNPLVFDAIFWNTPYATNMGQLLSDVRGVPSG